MLSSFRGIEVQYILMGEARRKVLPNLATYEKPMEIARLCLGVGLSMSMRFMPAP